MSIKTYLKSNIFKNTLVGIGPVTKNCVDATIEIANKSKFPIMLIASRRQIDSKENGGGYVNNWSTEEFSKYVFERSINNNLFLCRDHGGPWQGTNEYNLNEDQAMRRAKSSFATDMDCNFKIIHIDPSINSKGETDPTTYRKLEELLLFCKEYSLNKNYSDILYEIGTEEQNSSIHKPSDLSIHLKKIHKFCSKEQIDMPVFQVVQTGTKVMECENIGEASKLENLLSQNEWILKIKKLYEICSEYGVYIKEHNTDYLHENLLSLRPDSGISASNIAPEFGVYETREIINFLDEYSLNSFKEKFLDISFKSKKWEKWMIEDKQTSDYEKAVISGHYIFGTEQFSNLINSAVSHVGRDIEMLNDRLREILKKSIEKYLYNFRLN